jgi:acyl-CoA oxidase
MVVRLSRLAEEGKATIGAISSVKAWVSDKTREVARLGREMLGGDGIITDNYVIKALTDAEVIYTYEVIEFNNFREHMILIV